MNAVVLANGWIRDGRDGARQALDDFWTAVGKQMPIGMVTQGESDAISLSPASKLLANWEGYFSPSQLNPFDLNPLRDLIAAQVDFERLRAACPFKLFVGATQANSGKLRVRFAVAPEVAPRRINVVSPGSIDTPMFAAQGEQRVELYKKMTASNVIPRPGTPAEVAKGILFVIENDFVTGTTVDVDGGWLVS